jgi:hypothetical protein
MKLNATNPTKPITTTTMYSITITTLAHANQQRAPLSPRRDLSCVSNYLPRPVIASPAVGPKIGHHLRSTPDRNQLYQPDTEGEGGRWAEGAVGTYIIK